MMKIEEEYFNKVLECAGSSIDDTFVPFKALQSAYEKESNPELAEFVAEAMFNMTYYLMQEDRHEEAIALYDTTQALLQGSEANETTLW